MYKTSDLVSKTTYHFSHFDVDTVSLPLGSVSPGDMSAVRQSKAVLSQQLAHFPPELPLTPEGTASHSIYIQSISERLCPVALKRSTMTVFFE